MPAQVVIQFDMRCAPGCPDSQAERYRACLEMVRWGDANGISVAGSTLYCTNKPCVICTKMLINAGIEKIFYEDGYDDALADEMLCEAGIETVRLSP